MKNKNNNRKGFVKKYNHEGKFISLLSLTRVNLSTSGAESQKSEPTKYLKFLDLPQNGFSHKSAYSLDPNQILDSQSEWSQKFSKDIMRKNIG